MLENINYALFALLNATPASPQWAIEMAIFIAKDLILIVPLLVVTLWLWGPAQRRPPQRADGHCRRHRLVPCLSRRALAAGYGRRAAGRDVRLPWRGADLAHVRPGAIPSAAAAVSSLLLLANPQRLGARLNAAVAAATA